MYSATARIAEIRSEVAAWRSAAEHLAGLLAALHYKQYNTNEEHTELQKKIEEALKNYDIGRGRLIAVPF